MGKQIVRITGEVTDVEERNGVAKATGNPYHFVTATILVRRKSPIAVTLNDGLTVKEGDTVDWEVRAKTFNGDLQGELIGDWPVEKGAGLRAAAAANAS